MFGLKLSDRLIAYSAFVLFCVLSSARDVVSEVLFKDETYSGSPIFVLFVYSFTTQIVAGLLLIARGTHRIPLWSVRYELMWLNIFTLTAYAFYFFAIQTPLGAGINAFVDYGAGPIFTVLVASILLGQDLDKRLMICSGVSVLGIIVLSLPRLYSEDISPLWLLGLILALVSSASSAVYRVYFKIVLQKGVTPSGAIFFRMTALTVMLGVILLFRPELFRVDLLISTIIVGIIGFALPLFLVVSVIRRVSIPSLAMLLFLFPVLTFVLSVLSGHTQFYSSDIVAAAILLASVIFYESRAG